MLVQPTKLLWSVVMEIKMGENEDYCNTCSGINGYHWNCPRPIKENQIEEIMESRLMDLVKAMHEKFGLNNTVGPTLLTKDEFDFRVAAMQEELDEYKDAKNSVDQYDALLDLIVFAIGTLERQGFPLLQGFEAVMRANMAKELGQNGEKRGGFKRDLVKPKGWTGPEATLKDIISKERMDRVRGTPPPPLHYIDTLNTPFILSDMSPSWMKQVAKPNPIVEHKHNPIVEHKHNPIRPCPKDDTHKVRVDLLPIDQLMQVANVFDFGAKKYYANSYRDGDTVVWSRTYGSIIRHMMLFWAGEDNDQESGLSHLAHAGTQLFILMEHFKNNKDKDDRFKRG